MTDKIIDAYFASHVRHESDWNFIATPWIGRNTKDGSGQYVVVVLDYGEAWAIAASQTVDHGSYVSVTAKDISPAIGKTLDDFHHENNGKIVFKPRFGEEIPIRFTGEDEDLHVDIYTLNDVCPTIYNYHRSPWDDLIDIPPVLPFAAYEVKYGSWVAGWVFNDKGVPLEGAKDMCIYKLVPVELDPAYLASISTEERLSIDITLYQFGHMLTKINGQWLTVPRRS